MSGGGLKRSDGIEEGASVRTGGLRVVTEEDFCCLLFSSFSTAWRPTFSLQTLSSPQDFLHPLHVRSPGRTVGVLLRRAFFFFPSVFDPLGTTLATHLCLSAFREPLPVELSCAYLRRDSPSLVPIRLG